MISRRDDEIMPKGILRRSNKEISHYFASPAGRANFAKIFCYSSLEYIHTLRSSRREFYQNSLRQFDEICETQDDALLRLAFAVPPLRKA